MILALQHKTILIFSVNLTEKATLFSAHPKKNLVNDQKKQGSRNIANSYHQKKATSHTSFTKIPKQPSYELFNYLVRKTEKSTVDESY